MNVLSWKNRFLFQEGWIIWVSVSEIRVELKGFWQRETYIFSYMSWLITEFGRGKVEWFLSKLW